MTGRAQAAAAGALAVPALAAILLATAVVGPVRAQTIPEGQSCGGLVCDLGLFGHKTEPAPAAPPVTAPVPASATRPLAQAAPAPASKPRPPRPRKHLATTSKARPPAPPRTQSAVPAPIATPSRPPAAVPAVAARAPVRPPFIFQSIDPSLQ